MIREINYHGYAALSLETSVADVVIPSAIGPRVLRAGLKGQQNLFYNDPESMGNSGEADFELRGGHRLWVAPEDDRTYEPDNHPIEVEALEGEKGLLLKGPEDHRPIAGLRKEIQIEAVHDHTFRLTHRVTNISDKPQRLAPWGLTVMAYGGYGVIPLNPLRFHPSSVEDDDGNIPPEFQDRVGFLPSFSMIPWDYTDFSLPLWEFRSGRIGMRSSENKVPQKLGLSNYPGWFAYWQKAGTFVKYAPVLPDLPKPDLNSAFETFANDFMLEMETLAPWSELEPGASARHVEHWGLFADLPQPDTDEAWEREFRPVIEAWLKQCDLPSSKRA